MDNPLGEPHPIAEHDYNNFGTKYSHGLYTYKADLWHVQ